MILVSSRSESYSCCPLVRRVVGSAVHRIEVERGSWIVDETNDCSGVHANSRVTIDERGLCNLLTRFAEFDKGPGQTALDFEITSSEFTL